MVFGTIILLFAITGICNIPSVFAFTDTVYFLPSSYAGWYMGYLENRDEILINKIDAISGAVEPVNVYIMNEYQFEELQDSWGLIWNYVKRWQDVVYVLGWSFEITEDGNYYVVVYNKDILRSRTVNVDLDVRYNYYPPVKEDNFFLGWLLFIILPAIAVVVIIAVLIRKHKRKIPKEVIKPEIPIKVYCSDCGSEILDKSRKFCSNCGTKIIN